MRIPDSTIDDIRLATDIVEIISASVRLKKRGKNYLGLCPFHTEKTPSFTVSSEKQMFHCFGCGAGGNVFSFLMLMDKITFPEAVRVLGERAGISLPAPGAGAGTDANDPLYDACRRAGIHFYENLFKSPEGSAALEYFHHRGFTDETIRKFGLGCSLNSWDEMLRLGRESGIEPSTLERAGLVARREGTDRYYDRFRGRAMFPIFTPSGRTCGFGARQLREDDKLGKYINSPETPIFNKSRVLYGLYQAREAIRGEESAVMVEGYADLISLYQAGIENVVASSGTALTDEQIRLIGRYTGSVILVYDADSAGSKAMMRGVDLVIEHGLDVRVASLPAGEDPDSFVRKEGPDAFRKILGDASSFLDFKVARFREAGMFSTPEGQTRAVRSIVGTIAKMQDELKRNLYIRHLSERYGIYETVLFRELERHVRMPERETGTGRKPPPSSRPEPSNRNLMPAVDRDILKLMIENGPEMIAYFSQHLSQEDFVQSEARNVFLFLLEEQGKDREWSPAALVDAAKDEYLKNEITGLLFSENGISSGWEEQNSAPEEADPWSIAKRCVLMKQEKKIDVRMRENQEKLKEASGKGDDVKPFLEKHQELLKEKQQLVRSTLKDAE